MSAILKEITDLLTGRFEVPPERVTADATFGVLDLDSLSLEEFQMVIRDRFHGELWGDGEINLEMTLAEAATKLERAMQ